jgi:hypothetical protein
MTNDAYEQVDEALNLLNVTSEKVENEEVLEDLEAAIELLEEAQHSMEVAEEMNDMMQQQDPDDNMEGFTEI